MADIDDQESVITIKVKLESDVTGMEGDKGSYDPFLSDVTPDVDDIIDQEVQSTVDELVEKTLQEKFGIDTSGIENLTDMVNTLDKKGISELTQFAKSPQGFLEHGFIRLLSAGGPYGAILVAIITAVLATPQLFVALVEMLAVKGGPLNQDFRYSLDEQENQQFSRMVQYSRLVGDDPVITVTTKGFVVGDADFNFNTLLDANIARTARIGLRDSALGVIDGI